MAKLPVVAESPAALERGDCGWVVVQRVVQIPDGSYVLRGNTRIYARPVGSPAFVSRRNDGSIAVTVPHHARIRQGISLPDDVHIDHPGRERWGGLRRPEPLRIIAAPPAPQTAL